MDDQPDSKTADPILEDFFHDVVLPGMLADAIHKRQIDPKGKTPEEVRDEFLKILGDSAGRPDLSVHVVVSFEESLLREARRYRQAQQWHLAVTMYATWVEHRLNNLLLSGAQSRDLQKGEIDEILRGSIHAKTGLLWLLVFEERMDDSVRKELKYLADKRNGFVHYKWAPNDLATVAGWEFSSDMEEVAARAEALVSQIETMDRHMISDEFDVHSVVFPRLTQPYEDKGDA